MDWEEDAPVRYARSKTEIIYYVMDAAYLNNSIANTTHHPSFRIDRDI